MTGIAYVNGVWGPLAEARVSVLDRGFLFADGIYEVAAVLDGRLVDNDAHLARLQRSVDAIGIPLPLSLAEIEAVQKDVVARNAMREGLVYLQVTRGVDAMRDFLPSADASPTLVLFAQPRAILDSAAARTGIAIATLPDIRWERRDIKSVMLLAQVLAKQAAREAGCQEAWMVEDGQVTEGASSSAFILTQNGVLVTRPHSPQVLPGCTAAAVAELAHEQGLTIERRSFSIEEALQAREAFITSASTFVLPVVTIDGKPVGDGTVGPMAARLRAIYIETALRTAR